MRRFVAIASVVLMLIIGIIALAWATSPDPKFNPATFEAEPAVATIAPLDEAITLAQFAAEDGTIRTLLVRGYDGSVISGIDLAELGGKPAADPFEALATADLALLEVRNFAHMQIPVEQALPSGTSGTRHIGTGTNFPEHAEEANSGSVFQFPKFGPASPARTTVRAMDGILLDYEVELCMRFDRNIASAADFDAAIKAFFLCGDFTNRNALVELADPDNLDSGRGFSDSKSGPDVFPTGPFLVIPGDWKTFADELRMTTSVNGESRQDARGREMTLDFRELAEKALGDMTEPRFLYRDSYYRMAKKPHIDRTTTLMSGTAEGVIFTGPTRADYIEIGLAYLARGGPLGVADFDTFSRQAFIENERAGGHFLQPGDVVRHGSNYLGDIEVRVTG